MPISIDWGQKIIYVPRTYMTLIQSTPTEIRELNLNTFRLDLKDLEDNEEGITFLDTHRHNTEVNIGGLTLARVIEIINDYTVTFEDGQYAVNLTGANSNVGDRVNVNQVSVRSFNSAGMISSSEIEYASFNGGVTINVNSTNSGTAFPVGTPQKPVNNLSDAMLIAGVRGFNTLYVIGNLTVNLSGDYTGMIFIGESITKTTLTVETTANVLNTEFYDSTIQGVLDGNAKLQNCKIGNLSYIYGIVEDCILESGSIVLDGSNAAYFINCCSGDPSLTPVIDMGGSGQALSLRNYNGEITLINKIGSDSVSIDLNSGRVTLDNTVTNGQIVIRGTGQLTNNSTATIDSDDLLNRENITKTTWNTIFIDTDNGLSGTSFPIGTEGNPVDNISDARTIANNYNIKNIYIKGNITLDQEFSGFKFDSSSTNLGSISLNGQNISNSFFENVTLTGECNGEIEGKNCVLTDSTNLEGYFENTNIKDYISVASGKMLRIRDCMGLNKTVVNIDLNGTGTFFGYKLSGGFTIKNMTSPTSQTVCIGAGEVTLDSSITDGYIILGEAMVLFEDNATHYSVFLNNPNWRQVWKEDLSEYSDDSAADIIEKIKKLTALIPGTL